MEELALYIHIPFCQSKCKYCDFTSFQGQKDLIEAYVDSLKLEIGSYGPSMKNRQISSIFFGGGTPSAIDPANIYDLMETVNQNFKLGHNMEISLESNPGSLDREKMRVYKEAGINRISIGAQSFDNGILKDLGRTHKEQDIYRSLDIIRQAGINNINLDLMFGLPNQTLKDVETSLAKAIDLELDHISNYSLILEEGTLLTSQYERGLYQLQDEEVDRQMYEVSNNILSQAGYNHYEISNFAKPGQECRHNLVYWDIRPYLGLGLSSHSNLDGKRFSNTSKIHAYIRNLNKGKSPIVGLESISKSEEIAEYAIMGFRKIKGIDMEAFQARFQVDFQEYFSQEIRKNLKLGLISLDHRYIKLSRLGLNLSNQVELDFYKI